jgi:hypothetical protein
MALGSNQAVMLRSVRAKAGIWTFSSGHIILNIGVRGKAPKALI